MWLAEWIGILPTRIRRWIFDDAVLPPGFDKCLRYLTIRDKRARRENRVNRVARMRKANDRYIARKKRLRSGGVLTDLDKYI